MQQQLPNSLDPIIKNDQLLKLLANSPQTTQLIPMRAQEIIHEILQTPILVAASKNMEQLKEELQRVEKQKQIELKTAQEKILQQNYIITQQQQLIKKLQEHRQVVTKEVLQIQQKCHNSSQVTEKYQETIKQLTIKVHKLQEQIKIRQKANQQIQQISKQNDNKFEKQISGFKEEVFMLKQEIKQKKNFIQQQKEQYEVKINESKQKYINQIGQIRIILAQKSDFISNLEVKNQELEEEINKYRLSQQKILESEGKLRQSCQIIQKQNNKLKKKMTIEIYNRNRQRKQMNHKLAEMSKKSRIQDKIIIKIHFIKENVVKLHRNYEQIRNSMDKKFSNLFKEVKENVNKIIDQMGSNINQQLEQIKITITHTKRQLDLYKQENQVKNEIIQRLEHMIHNQTNGTTELKNQLRVKKRDEERLRRQLKRHYEQTQFKLESMEKKCVEMLHLNRPATNSRSFNY